MRVVALSRWNNYYVEGVQQMMRDFSLDGCVSSSSQINIPAHGHTFAVLFLRTLRNLFTQFCRLYLDEIAYDRITMMRARKLLDQRSGVIDHHSDSGAFCVSPAMIYNEHYPFIDKLWYGEGFPYDTATPDYWLVEMSGLVFGLTADMLRYPGETPYHFKVCCAFVV